MKTIESHLLRICLVIAMVAGYLALQAQDNGSYYTVTGRVRDAGTKDAVVNATISVPGTGIGTVTNAEGGFILKVSKSLNAETFEISHISYASARFGIAQAAEKEKDYFLEPHAIYLKGVTVFPGDARSVVERAMSSIRRNYSEVPNMMTGFYRETIRQRRDYISIAEAVVDIYKASYISPQEDQVKIFKGRKGTDVKKVDTLMVQLQGGPNVSMLLDIVKNADLSISLNNLDNYIFEFASMTQVDDKLNWVISFFPATEKPEPLYTGKLYISQETMAITRAEFSLDLTDPDKAAGMFVRKKPAGLIFVPTLTSYTVVYKEQNGKNYLNYVRVELRFKCDWKKKLFKNNYTILSEVAITDRRADNIGRFASQDVFRTNMVFSEKVQSLGDPGFWGEHNIIEPEQSIENAIRKISKTMKK